MHAGARRPGARDADARASGGGGIGPGGDAGLHENHNASAAAHAAAAGSFWGRRKHAAGSATALTNHSCRSELIAAELTCSFSRGLCRQNPF